MKCTVSVFQQKQINLTLVETQSFLWLLSKQAVLVQEGGWLLCWTCWICDLRTEALILTCHD